MRCRYDAAMVIVRLRRTLELMSSATAAMALPRRAFIACGMV